MQTLTIELTGKDSLKALPNLEQKELIRIVQEPDPNLYSLSGEPMTDEDFKNWIECAESTPTLSLTEAKQLWTLRNQYSWVNPPASKTFTYKKYSMG